MDLSINMIKQFIMDEEKCIRQFLKPLEMLLSTVGVIEILKAILIGLYPKQKRSINHIETSDHHCSHSPK